ncbi:hypothetical protein [Novosphingobium mangrovi (ex Huang et al. 2023)]|uniref:17 kDa surface antigen n=1 Tax=Novosphingobium mangrovi (ex Huang et al. 2023) TaxID=2976432 RepID=A0ABT2I5Q4_9SPHN|nr:hypothetical protein [Novosphingobium mangrovi (ex Huang et al. 2023)]MCT2400136.1 hypothetical protein [Novosphingobium mangrovi (ex Huang et al. 2023)]
MKIFRSRTAASLAALAALSMTATPVFARGYDRGYPRHHHHRGGIDGGDVLAGLLIVGGIAAIASAASKSNREPVREDRYAYPGGPAYDESGYVEVPPVRGYAGSDYPGGPVAAGGFDGAVDACTGEIEGGDRRIGSVDNVRRMGERYSVEGQLEDGRGYACSVDESGRVRSVAVDGRAMI